MMEENKKSLEVMAEAERQEEPKQTGETGRTGPSEHTENAQSELQKQKYPYNIVIWAQIVMCVLAAVFLCVAKMQGFSFYSGLRTMLRQEMEKDGWQLEEGGRRFLAFTQQRLAEAEMAGKKVFAKTSNTQSASEWEQAERIRHNKAETVPYGYNAASYWGGEGFAYPLAGNKAEVNSGYGWRTNPLDGVPGNFHGGVDLKAGMGDFVYAVLSGVVRCAGSHSSYGNYIRVLHADGTETLYAHMQYLFVRGGKRIAKGERIGTVGQTGNTTGPHLHFEILYRGTRYDPTAALQKAAPTTPGG